MRRVLPLLLLLPPAAAQEKIDVLIVSGANNHDWEWTTPSLESMLVESGRFDVAITYEPAKDLARGLAGYAAVVLDYNGPPWGEAAEAAFLEAVRGGLGVTVVHAANNAFPGWVEYETLVGHLWRGGTGHGRFHPFDVTVVQREHPITATLPDIVKHPDELYHRLVHMHGSEREVLATALSSKESGGTGEHEPMILVGTYGQGRVFHTPLGHVWKGVTPTRVSHADPQFRNLIVRGTEWVVTGRVTDGLEHPNHLTSDEARAGWRLLFDGETTRGWRGWKREEFPETGWEVVNGCLRRHARGGGDLVTSETFANFELAFEWKVAGGVNSGVKYRVIEGDGAAPIAPEYQILDDARSTEDDDPRHGSGALYDVLEPNGARLAHAGAFNHSRILCRGSHVEHWLNGVKILEAEVGDPHWTARKAASKFRNVADFAAQKAGRILLQDHGGEVWYRSIRIRNLTPHGEEQSLLAGDSLGGWTPVGDAVWSREGDTIVGSVGDGLGRNSFLRTERTFGDFVFEVDVLVAKRGNSGIQFRSKQRGDGVVVGYQAEIDCGERAWSGGVYDESRRGWLDDLRDNPAGRRAFRLDDWNHYRIEAIGDHLRVWVNGVATADLRDGADAEGFLALQVHGGSTGTFRWRDPRVWVLSE